MSASFASSALSRQPTSRLSRPSGKDINAKRAKREYSWYTEKFTPGHKYKNRQLYLIGADKMEDDELLQSVSDEQVMDEPHIFIRSYAFFLYSECD